MFMFISSNMCFMILYSKYLVLVLNQKNKPTKAQSVALTASGHSVLRCSSCLFCFVSLHWMEQISNLKMSSCWGIMMDVLGFF